MTRSCLSAFDSREADDPSSMAPGFYAFPHEDYDRAPVGPFPTYVEAVTAARAEEGRATHAASNLVATLPADLFSSPYADLDDVQARIGTVLDFLDIAASDRAFPADLSFVTVCARETLATLQAIRGAKTRAKAFRAEHGFETLKGLWFAFADHAASLGLQSVAAEVAR